MEFTKELEGQIIYGLTTGNDARGGAKIVKFMIVKVKRKYIDLCMFDNINIKNPSTSIIAYDPKTGATESQTRAGYGGNSGHIFFATLQDVQNEIARKKMVTELIQPFNPFSDLSYEALKAVYDIIKADREASNA